MRWRGLRCVSCRRKHQYSVTNLYQHTEYCLDFQFAACLTFPLADVPSLVLTVVVIPVAAIDVY